MDDPISAVERTTKDGIVVEIGQAWLDCDGRVGVRRAEVVGFEMSLSGHSKRKGRLRDRPTEVRALMKRGSRITKVAIRRMYKHSTGWTPLE